MTGQIPKYGQHFRRESTPYHPVHAGRVYAFKRDPSWFIRSDKTSERWTIYHGRDRVTANAVSVPQSTFTEAMGLLLAGVSLGFYVTESEQ